MHRLSPTLPSRNLGIALLMALGLAGGVLAAPLPDADMPALFYSPVERQHIEQQRKGMESDDPEKSVAPEQIQFNGLVHRKEGKSTVWINQRPWPEGTMETPGRQGRIGPNGFSIDGHPLRVGETFDLNTGQKTDFIPSGAVTAPPATRQKQR